MDKNKIKNKLKNDPAFTLEVQNPEVEALMTQYSSDKKAETLNKLIEKCTKSRFLVPANVGEKKYSAPVVTPAFWQIPRRDAPANPFSINSFLAHWIRCKESKCTFRWRKSSCNAFKDDDSRF